jgi:hypothetical protein
MVSMAGDQATLGFAGGPAVTFRVNPDNIYWNWTINTNVIETIGGRVIQVIGAYLDNLIVTGSLGQDHSTPQGVSWRQAEAFLKIITQIMEYQSRDSRQQDKMHPPAIFTFPSKGWRFQCYVLGLDDADSPGTSIVMTPGKFNQRYELALFIVDDASETLVKAGESNGVINQKQAAAIQAYMARISNGIGWQFTQYNGPVSSAPPTAKATRAPSGAVTPVAPGKLHSVSG